MTAPPPRANSTRPPQDRLAGAVWGMLAGAALAAQRRRVAEDVETPAGTGARILLGALAEHGADADAYARALRTAEAPFTPGGGDDGSAATARLAPLVALRAGDARLMLDVDRFTRVLQDDDRAVAYACAHARLLEELFAGGDLERAVARVNRMVDRRTPLGRELAVHLDAARPAQPLAVDAAMAGFGRNARLVEALPAALHAAWRFEDDPAEAIRAAAESDGDNAGAGGAMLVGSWLGARHGVAAIPSAWRARLAGREAIAAQLERLLARRSATTPARH